MFGRILSMDNEELLPKIKVWTNGLLNVLDKQINRTFCMSPTAIQDERIRRLRNLIEYAEAKSRLLAQSDSSYTLGDTSNNLKEIEESLRELIVILYQIILKKTAPTDILYFKMFNIDISSNSLLDPLAINYLKIVFLLCCTGLLLSFIRTNDVMYINIIQDMRDKTITIKDSKMIMVKTFILIKAAAIVLSINQENEENLKQNAIMAINAFYSEN